MKRFFRLLINILIFAVLFSAFAYADDSETMVRIRIRRPRCFNEQVNLITNDKIYIYDITKSEADPILVLDNYIDVLLDTFYDSRFLFTDNVQNANIGPYHIRLSDYLYYDYQTAKNESSVLTQNFGKEFYPFYDGDSYQIYCGQYTSEADALQAQSELSGYSFNTILINGLDKNVIVYNKEDKVELMYSSNYNIYFTEYNENLLQNTIKIDKELYRGMMAFTAEPGKLISINRVPLNFYLYGVVPNEISSSWHIEAIKAQVLAARTYAVSSIKSDASSGYDMQDNQNSQVYGGYSSEKQITNNAVDETNGQMIYYEDKLITAFFHSTSGGKTENSENIWVTQLPYLKAVDDPYSNISPYTEWQKIATKNFLLSRIKETFSNVNNIYDIYVSKYSENYRALECIISTDIGDITLKKENIRLVIGTDFLLSSWFTIGNNSNVYLISENSYVPSKQSIEDDNNDGQSSEDETGAGDILSIIVGDNSSENDEGNEEGNEEGNGSNTNNDDITDRYKAFNIDDVSVNLYGKYFISSKDSNTLEKESFSFISADGISQMSSNANEYYFEGRGWGHGVGMSQYGAKAMAEAGFTYDEILKYYYTGVEIK